PSFVAHAPPKNINFLTELLLKTICDNPSHRLLFHHGGFHFLNLKHYQRNSVSFNFTSAADANPFLPTDNEQTAFHYFLYSMTVFIPIIFLISANSILRWILYDKY
ncbi:MAG: hypothetical protein ACOYN6_11705, partial [Ignavibacteria bacterium]